MSLDYRKVTFGDKTIKIVPSMQAMLDIEDEFGCSILQVCMEVGEGRTKFVRLVKILQIAIRNTDGQDDIEFEELCDMCFREPIGVLAKSVSDFLTAYLVKTPDKAKSDGKKKIGQKVKS